MSLPGVCIGCGVGVVWRGKSWMEGLNPHRCKRKTRACGAWMPHAKEPCARRRGHGLEHRSRYALDNDALSIRRARAS